MIKITFIILVFILIFSPVSGGLQGSALINSDHYFLPSRTVALVFLGSKLGLSEWNERIQEIVYSDELIDFNLTTKIIVESTPIKSGLGENFRTKFGLSTNTEVQRIWVLLNRDGQVIESGEIIPTKESIVKALQFAGETLNVAKLKAFLKENPDHCDARKDLIRLLRSCVINRIKVFSLAKGRDFSPEEDSRVWGDLPQELDILLGAEPWSGLHINLDDLLPPGVPERFSPSVKSVFRRHRFTLLHGLLSYPESGLLWRNLLRMDNALGESGLIQTLGGLSLFAPPTNNYSFFPFGPVAQRVYSEAKQTGSWDIAAPILRTIWNDFTRPKLNFYDKAWFASTSAHAPAAKVVQLAWDERNEAWNAVLEPTIEALVRVNSEDDVSSILKDLDDSWTTIGLVARLQRLADTLGRPDLAKAWIPITQSLPQRIPREGMIGNVLILRQDQDTGRSIHENWEYQKIFLKHGIALNLLDVTTPWRKWLGWTSNSPKWAMVDNKAQVILSGDKLLSPKGMLDSFLMLRSPHQTDIVDAFLKDNPGSLEALAFKSKIIGSMLQIYCMERHEIRLHAPKNFSIDNEERKLIDEYCSLLRRLFDHPLGTSPRLTWVYVRNFANGPMQLSSELEEGLKDLAQRRVPSLEKEIARWPSESVLWENWLALAPFLDRSAADLLLNIAPSPMSKPSDWPTQEFLVRACRELRNHDRWQAMVDLLEQRMQLKLDEAEIRLRRNDPGVSYTFIEKWNSELTGLLVEAYENLGLFQNIEKINKIYSAIGAIYSIESKKTKKIK